MKLPVPVPSENLVSKEIVGVDLVLHTTPLDNIGEPPSLLIFPPDVALVDLIKLIAVVIIIGSEIAGLLVTSGLLREPKWRIKEDRKIINIKILLPILLAFTILF